MNWEELMKDVEYVSVQDAAPLYGKSEPTIRRQLREGRLVGDHWGRDWRIPILRDDEGRAVFLVKGDK
jgi:hypothetical protein